MVGGIYCRAVTVILPVCRPMQPVINAVWVNSDAQYTLGLRFAFDDCCYS
jgi:hypothetical protein